MGRRCAAGVSRVARAGLVTGVTMDTFIITCEHGGNRIPAPYRRLFRGRRVLLDSHRGYDPGALVMARALARAFRAPLVTSTISRLLVDSIARSVIRNSSRRRRVARRRGS